MSKNWCGLYKGQKAKRQNCKKYTEFWSKLIVPLLYTIIWQFFVKKSMWPLQRSKAKEQRRNNYTKNLGQRVILPQPVTYLKTFCQKMGVAFTKVKGQETIYVKYMFDKFGLSKLLSLTILHAFWDSKVAKIDFT